MDLPTFETARMEENIRCSAADDLFRDSFSFLMQAARFGAACFEKEGNMYIWIGCGLPSEFECAIRSRCLELNGDIGLGTVAFSLPQHISLKISFEAGAHTPEILDAVEALLRQEKQFYVNINAIETAGSILWITFQENPVPQRLHHLLDSTLEQAFGIPQHPFDKDFLFHSTLFLGEPERLARMQAGLSGFALPPDLVVDTFLLGLSETGEAGSFRVVRQIKV